jgi:hypothetical protein
MTIDPLDINTAKVQAVIAHAWAGLDPDDQAQRLAYDEQHGIYGVIMLAIDGELVEFRRGGRAFAVVTIDLLCGDGQLEADAVFNGECPDDPSGLDGQ